MRCDNVSLSFSHPGRRRSSPALSENPPSIAQPPYSSVLNATTQGAFLPSLFSLSSQCRFAVSRGVVVERRKQEEINREGQKAGRQTRYRAGESSKTFSTFDKQKYAFKSARLINGLYLVSVRKLREEIVRNRKERSYIYFLARIITSISRRFINFVIIINNTMKLVNN